MQHQFQKCQCRFGLLLANYIGNFVGPALVRPNYCIIET